MKMQIRYLLGVMISVSILDHFVYFTGKCLKVGCEYESNIRSLGVYLFLLRCELSV